ncbi:hypothetical protein AWN76_012980 [Rhodothermaceae bacterium RA]|nr:hypothetical protein AWN76_012980 [Rhodothermaceae bacterium RA]
MNTVFKWIGIGLGGVVLLLAVFLTALYVRGGSLMTEPVSLPSEAVAAAPADSAALAWGQHLVQTHACSHCHGAQLEGAILADAPPFLLVAPNLTSGQGGIGATYTDADWERAIRHGVAQSGRGLAVMPSDAFAYLDDRELTAMVAYLKTIPAVDHVLPPTSIRPLGRILAGAGQLSTIDGLIDHERAHLTAPPPGPTVAFGAYRAHLCKACHGQDLLGAPHPEPGAPYSPSLASVKGWTEAEFVTAMRTGTRPGGTALDDTYMPWTSLGQMTDEELQALYLYLQTLPDARPGESV